MFSYRDNLLVSVFVKKPTTLKHNGFFELQAFFEQATRFVEPLAVL